jgi:hypothetical protein
MGLLTNLIGQVNDILFERIDSTSLDDATKRSIKKRVTLMVMIFGILLAPAYFYAASWLFDVTPKDHLTFLQGKDPYEEKYKLLKQHLNEVNEKINAYERVSLKQQKVLFASMERNFVDEKERTKALQIVNRTQDIITKLMELGKFYSVLVKDGKQTEETQQALLLMYEGWLDVLKSEYDTRAISDAFKKYSEVYNTYLNDFPEALRRDIKIELLNVLTYCDFRRGYHESAKRYLAEAKTLLNESILPIEYRRKYYWIDFAVFIEAVSHLDSDKADIAFENLNKRLNDPRFLRAKLLQHKGMLTKQDQQVMVDSYLSDLLAR